MFRTIISENQEYIGSIPLVERPLDLEEHGNYVFVGDRQESPTCCINVCSNYWQKESFWRTLFM